MESLHEYCTKDDELRPLILGAAQYEPLTCILLCRVLQKLEDIESILKQPVTVVNNNFTSQPKRKVKA